MVQFSVFNFGWAQVWQIFTLDKSHVKNRENCPLQKVMNVLFVRYRGRSAFPSYPIETDWITWCPLKRWTRLFIVFYRNGWVSPICFTWSPNTSYYLSFPLNSSNVLVIFWSTIPLFDKKCSILLFCLTGRITSPYLILIY